MFSRAREREPALIQVIALAAYGDHQRHGRQPGRKAFVISFDV
jgi:hypothetical protein